MIWVLRCPSSVRSLARLLLVSEDCATPWTRPPIGQDFLYGVEERGLILPLVSSRVFVQYSESRLRNFSASTSSQMILCYLLCAIEVFLGVRQSQPVEYVPLYSDSNASVPAR